MNKVWIACDWHLWNRKNNYSHPYRSISSIGKLSDNYTIGISPTDIFVHLGDIADPEKADKEKLKTIIQSIPAGYKVLCKGNHDTEPDDYYYSLGFDTVCEICTLYNVVLSHFPVKVNEDEVNVHAHLHSEKLSSLGYQHINAYKANFNDGPTSLDDLLDTAIFQDEAEYKSTDMVHYEKKFTEYTSAMFGNRFTQIVDISDRVPLAPIEESAKPQLDDSDADEILNEILFDDVEDTQYWMADDNTYQNTVRTIDYPGNRKTITNESATNKNDHVDTLKINNNEIEVYRKESINPNDPVGKEAHDLAFYMEGKKIADISISAVKSKVAFVYNFEVKPKYRNQGIGSAIFKYVMSKYHINELTVDKTNTGAIKFYKRFGFKVSQEFTEDNIKRLDMKIRLNEEAADNAYYFNTPEELHRWMRQNIKYANFNTLMNQDDVSTSHKGSCHDQVAFAYPILKKMGLHPKILFFIEYREGLDEGGMTHSLIYYEKNGKIYWFENAWNGMQGIHQYDSVEDLKKQIIRMHNNMPSSKKFPDLEFKQIPFSKFKKGSSLGDFVGSIMNEAADVSEYADIYMSRITELTDNANQDESMFKHISKLTHVPVEQLPKFSPKLTVKTDKQLCFEMIPSNIPWKIKVEYERFLLKIIKKLNKTKADLPYTGTIWTADGDCLLYVNLNDTPMNEMYLSSLSATGAHAEEILNDDTESLKEMTPEEKKKIADKYGLKSTGVYREKETEANKTAEDRKKERDQKRLEDLKKAREIHKRNTRIRRIKKKIPFIKNETANSDMILYHGSPKTFKTLKVYDSGISGAHAFATSKRSYALAYAGAQWSDFEINQSRIGNTIYLTEIIPGKFKEIFDRPGYIHMVSSNGFKPFHGVEYISDDNIQVKKTERIPNVLEELESSPDIKLFYFPHLPPFIKDREEYLKSMSAKYGNHDVSKMLQIIRSKQNESMGDTVVDTDINSLYDQPPTEQGGLFDGQIRYFHGLYDSEAYVENTLCESYQFELLDNVKFVEPLQESVEEYKDEPLYPVYIMLIHSGSALANAIKFMTQSNFSHSSISFDASMTNMYSFGRKADTNPFAGGFKKESIKSQFYTSRTIPYALYMVACTKSQVDQMKKRLNYFIKNSSKFKYDFTGLFKNYFGIADNPEYQWFCSRFVADILNAGRPGEHPYVVEPSLMRPEDFMHTTYAHYVTGGVLSNYDVKAVEKKVKTMLKLERMNRILESKKMAVNESAVLDLDPFNPYQSATLKYQLSQMDESATEHFLDYIRSFKIRFDKNGNIRVTRREYDQLDQHFRRSVRITKAAVKAGNTAMVKDELCKVYYMVSLIDNHYSKLPPVTTDPKQKQVRKDLLDLRSVMLNMFNQNLKYVTVAEPNFNFNSYYASSKYGKDVTIPKQIVTAVGKTIITLL